MEKVHRDVRKMKIGCQSTIQGTVEFTIYFAMNKEAL